jgi:hypothetical protein
MLHEIFTSILFNVFLFVSAIASIVSLLLGVQRYRWAAIITHVADSQLDRVRQPRRRSPYGARCCRS